MPLSDGSAADIALDAVTKRFGAGIAVNAVSAIVPDGAFFALLGPSGCGKTTLLRLIAGLERPDGGRIAIGGQVVAGGARFVEPQERGLGMVFQSYALWPHMTVAGNVAFGLSLRGVDRAACDRRVAEVLDLVGLGAHAARRPHELSGGQRQRVALARSLAVRPRLILLDEPLANLDAHLRQAMLAEFRRIHRESGTTFVFVTHDQNEAMALADLVAVMDRGRIEQIGAPQELFERPASPMVARFVGQGRTVPVEVLGPRGARRRVRLHDREIEIAGEAPAGPGWLCLRSRDIVLAGPGGDPGGAGIAAQVVGQHFEGGDYVLSLALPGLGAEGIVEARAPRPAATGSMVGLTVTGGWVLPREAAA